jgi:hypothetical protein
MRLSRRYIICACGILLIVGIVQAQGWRGIVPLHSKREDVERAIGSPMKPRGTTYDLKNERVTIVYSDGSCVNSPSSEWNVPRDTVITIIRYPQTKLMLADLGIDLSKYEKSSNPHNPDSIDYTSKEEGVGVGARSNGEVVVVQYFPAATDSYLRCPGSSRPQLSYDEMEYYKFDEYSNISFSEEKARLANFATYLQRKPEMKGYITIYAKRGTHSGETKAQAERVKNYVVNECGIERERVITIDGGYREKKMVELYILPRDVSPPSIAPTADPSEMQIIKTGGAKNNNRRSIRLCRQQ